MKGLSFCILFLLLATTVINGQKREFYVDEDTGMIFNNSDFFKIKADTMAFTFDGIKRIVGHSHNNDADVDFAWIPFVKRHECEIIYTGKNGSIQIEKGQIVERGTLAKYLGEIQKIQSPNYPVFQVFIKTETGVHVKELNADDVLFVTFFGPSDESTDESTIDY